MNKVCIESSCSSFTLPFPYPTWGRRCFDEFSFWVPLVLGSMTFISEGTNVSQVIWPCFILYKLMVFCSYLQINKYQWLYKMSESQESV